MEDGLDADLYGTSRRLLEDGDYNAFDIDQIVSMLSLPGTPSLGDFLIDSGISPYAVDEVCLNRDNMGELPKFKSNPCKNASFWEKKYRSNYQPLVFIPDLDDRVSINHRHFLNVFVNKLGRAEDDAEKQKRDDLAELYIWRSICFTAYRKARRDIVRIFYKLLKKFKPLWILLESGRDTPLYQKLQKELDDRIREIIYSGILIEPGAAVNEEYKGETCLTIAAKVDDVRLFKMLLHAGAIPTESVRKVAYEYVSNNLIKRIIRRERRKKEIILKENIVYDPEIELDGQIRRAFRNAIKDGDEKEVIRILEKYREKKGIVNAQITEHGATPLIYAVFRLETEIVRVLLDQKGIDVNRKNYRDETALIIASRLESLEPKGVHIRDMDTLLRLQMISRQEEIVRMLLDRPTIDVNKFDLWGKAAIHYAVSDDNEGVSKMLINAPGAILDMRIPYDGDYTSLLEIANRNKNKTIIRQLFRRGASTKLGYIDDMWGYKDVSYDIAESNIKENAEWGSIF
jgi:ankyrin repeat protein